MIFLIEIKKLLTLKFKQKNLEARNSISFYLTLIDLYWFKV